MTDKIYRVQTHDRFKGWREWRIEAEDPKGASRTAARTAALDSIAPYESYASDSAYSDDLDRAAGEVEVYHVEETPGLTGGEPVANGSWYLGSLELTPGEATAPPKPPCFRTPPRPTSTPPSPAAASPSSACGCSA